MSKKWLFLGIIICLLLLGVGYYFYTRVSVETEGTATAMESLTDKEILGQDKVRIQIQKLTDEIIKNPENPAFYYNRSHLYRSIGNSDSAYLDLYKYMRLQPSDTAAYLLGIKYYMEEDDGQSAMGLVDDALKILPESASLLTERGKLLFYLKKYEDAKLSLNKASLINPPYAPAFFYNGLLAKEIGRDKDAITLLEKVLSIDPDYYDAKILLGKWYESTNKKRAEDYYQNAIAQDKQGTEALYALAMLYQSDGDYKQAKSHYKQLISRDKNQRFAWYNLGYIYHKEDSLELAIKHFEIAIATYAAYPEAYYMRGLCEEQAGNFSLAIKDYEQALVFKQDYELAQAGLKRIKANNKPLQSTNNEK